MVDKEGYYGCMYICREEAVIFGADDKDTEVESWVGLTDEDMKDPRTHNFDFIRGARWAEAKLKEKNHER